MPQIELGLTCQRHETGSAHIRVDGTHRCQCGAVTFPIDYRDLLKKFLQHVRDEEPVPVIEGRVPSDRFDAEEWAALQTLDQESR